MRKLDTYLLQLEKQELAHRLQHMTLQQCKMDLKGTPGIAQTTDCNLHCI